MSAIALAWVARIKVGNQTAKQLLHFYAAHNFGKPGFEFTIKTLVEQLETSERDIQRAHALLLEQKLIIKKARYSKSGQQLPNLLYLNIPQSFVDNFLNGDCKITANGGGRVSGGRGEGVSMAPLNNKINNKKLLSSCASKAARPVDKSFDEFWKRYPKKKNKEEAKRKWKKIPPEVIPLILEKLEQQKAHELQWQNPEYIPLASTYLHNKRWEDEIVTASPKKLVINKSNKPEIHSTVREWAPGHPGYDSMNGFKQPKIE